MTALIAGCFHMDPADVFDGDDYRIATRLAALPVWLDFLEQMRGPNLDV